MYLHYYLNQKYVGTVDIEVFFDTKSTKTLIACSEDCENHLLGLELVYGKSIPRIKRDEAWDMQHGHYSPRGQQKRMSMPAHVFTTRKCGPVLTWSDYDRTLACKL